MQNTIWSDSHVDEELVEKLSQQCNIDKILAKLLIQRNIKTANEVQKFLEPDLKNITDPFKLKDVEKAVQRIEKTIENNELITIFGDYDVDGITSTSLLFIGLSNLGFRVTYHIPSRDDGYGLNVSAIEEIAKNSRLLISVDCGISAHQEIEVASKLNLDVIVTDHHDIQSIPKAYAVINPKRTDNMYQFQNIAGVGTAFMLLYALYKARSGNLEELFDLLDLVAIGTISDVVPLIGENRIFVKHGLMKLQNSKNIGLNLLQSRFNVNSVTDVGFKLAPMFNAAGRLENSSLVVEFLTSTNIKRVEEILNKLESLNKERQNIGKNMLTMAQKMVTEDGLIVCASEEFHHGLIGIVAARLVDQHNAPAIVLSIKPDGTAVGSARSVDGFNLVENLDLCKEFLIKFGGHDKAAGLTIHKDNISKFRDKIREIFKAKGNDRVKEIKTAGKVFDFHVSVEFCRIIDQLKPFGQGNPEPIFILENVQIANARKIGKTLDHLMFDVKNSKSTIKNAVWFQHGDKLDLLSTTKRYDLAFRIEENFFNNKLSGKVYVEDIKESVNDICNNTYYKNMCNTNFPIRSVIISNEPLPSHLDIKDINGSFFFNNKKLNLNFELDNLLKELQKNYFMRFRLETLSHTKKEELFLTEIAIYRCLELRKNSNEKEIFTEIKNLLIGPFQYNEIQKKVLRKILIENQSISLKANKGRGIKTIATAIAMYLYYKTGQKSIFISTSKRPLSYTMAPFFEISTQDMDGPFKFVDNVDLEISGLHMKFYDQDSKIDINTTENTKLVEHISDEILITKNIIFVNPIELTLSKNTYNRYIKIEDKIEYLNKIKNNEEIVTNRDILALL